jgi:hypothetical protein
MPTRLFKARLSEPDLGNVIKKEKRPNSRIWLGVALLCFLDSTVLHT